MKKFRAILRFILFQTPAFILKGLEFICFDEIEIISFGLQGDYFKEDKAKIAFLERMLS